MPSLPEYDFDLEVCRECGDGVPRSEGMVKVHRFSSALADEDRVVASRPLDFHVGCWDSVVAMVKGARGAGWLGGE